MPISDSSNEGVEALRAAVVAVDVTGDGVPDILTASKLGSILFVTKRDRLPK